MTLFVAAVLTIPLLAHDALPDDTVRIVALGGSNTRGKGVGTRSAWPAQLEKLLKQKGYAVKIVNKGVDGLTTAQMRGGVKLAVGSNARIAILEIPLTNDRINDRNTDANVAAMKSILRKKGVRVIIVDRPRKWAERKMQGDGLHFNVAGHGAIANKLVPMVISEIRKLQ